jgi:phage shock protein A
MALVEERVTRLESRVEAHETRIVELEKTKAADKERFSSIREDIAEIKDSQRRATWYTLTTLVTVILAIIGFWLGG